MISPIVDLLFHPNVFFKNLMTEKENLVPPALIILVIGIFGAASAYLTSILTANMLGTTGFAPSVIIGIAVIFAFFGVFVSWAIISGIFYVISIVFKGNGEFSRSLEIVGYGFIPRIIGSFITLVFALVYLPQVIVPKITQDMLRDPQACTERNKSPDERSGDGPVLPDLYGSHYCFSSLEHGLLDLRHEIRTSINFAECSILCRNSGYSVYSVSDLRNVSVLCTLLRDAGKGKRECDVSYGEDRWVRETL